MPVPGATGGGVSVAVGGGHHWVGVGSRVAVAGLLGSGGLVAITVMMMGSCSVPGSAGMMTVTIRGVGVSAGGVSKINQRMYSPTTPSPYRHRVKMTISAKQL